jgi:hypothetical protein
MSAAHSLYEHGMASLADDLERIVSVLNETGIAYEVIGGVAVNAHLMDRHRSRSFVTRDVDLLIRREDLDLVAVAGLAAGYEGRKIMGGYVLIRAGQDSEEAVHLVFSGERSKSNQPLPHPPLRPEIRNLFGLLAPVAPLSDLVRMKLTSFRPKDVAHLEILDEAGLITASVEDTLPAELKSRLEMARQQFAEGRPDVE